MRDEEQRVRRLLGAFGLGCVLAGGLFGCSDKGEQSQASAACAAPAASIPAADAKLPTSFPLPAGVVLTASVAKGPSQVSTGYADTGLAPLSASFASALAKPPFGVTKNEKDAHDAEVDFTGSGTTGQVKMSDLCKGRVSVEITARPA